MGPMDNEYLRRFRIALEDWTDERMITREQIHTLAMFNMYLVNLADADGWQYDGHSYKRSPYLDCLVVKATVDGIPSVVFTSAKTHMGCVKIFLRKLKDGALTWQKDKYRS